MKKDFVGVGRCSCGNVNRAILAFGACGGLGGNSFVELSARNATILTSTGDRFINIILTIYRSRISILIGNFVRLPVSSTSTFPTANCRCIISSNGNNMLDTDANGYPHLIISTPIDALGTKVVLWSKEGLVVTFSGVGLSGKLCSAAGNFATSLRRVSPSRGCVNARLRKLSTCRERLGEFSVGIDNESSSYISGFFDDASSTTLFPRCVDETITRNVRRGSILSGIITAAAVVSSLSCHSIRLTASGTSGRLTTINRNTLVPRARVGAGSGLAGLRGENEVLITSCRTVGCRGLSLFALVVGRLNTRVTADRCISTVRAVLCNDAGAVDTGGGPPACSSLIRV